MMQNLILGRRTYWLSVAALIVLKIGLVIVLISAPQTMSFLRHVDTAIIIVLAMVVGGRFADIGWPRWLGIALVLVFAIVVPIILLFASPPAPVPNSEPLDFVPDLAWIGTVMQLILLIVAGVKGSVSRSHEGMGGNTAEQSSRKQPNFP